MLLCRLHVGVGLYGVGVGLYRLRIGVDLVYRSRVESSCTVNVLVLLSTAYVLGCVFVLVCTLYATRKQYMNTKTNT